MTDDRRVLMAKACKGMKYVPVGKGNLSFIFLSFSLTSIDISLKLNG